MTSGLQKQLRQWRMGGVGIAVPVNFSVDASFPLGGEGIDPFLVPMLSRVPGLVLAARYDTTSTLAYSELAIGIFARPDGGRLGFYPSRLWVDSGESIEAGEAHWGLRKEMADFQWQEEGGQFQLKVGAMEGELLTMSGRVPSPGMSLPTRLACFSLGEMGRLLRWSVRSRSMMSRTRVAIQTPTSSPLSPLSIAGTRLGFYLNPLHLSISIPRS